MAKWNIRFSGGKSDLYVDEFLFRVETLATSAGIDYNYLPLGMHYVLHGQAQEWFWIFYREFPEANWTAMKAALRNQFSSLADDFELWDQIRARKQQSNENFSQFYLAMAAMCARFEQRIPEDQLVRLLRSNMSHGLKRALLYQPTNSLHELQEAAKQFEKLGRDASSSLNNYRPTIRRVNEIDGQQYFEAPTQSFDTNEVGTESYGDPPDCTAGNVSVNSVEAVTDSRIVRPNMPPPICWNCDDIGHTFQDCQVATRNVFCYGCGTKNVYRPNCSRCSSGNSKPGGLSSGQFRPNPNVLQQDPTQVIRRPNPFTRK